MKTPDLDRLCRVMTALREGCPWDRKQTLASLKTYVLEETYEVLAALDREGPDDLREELGDLLFQIVFLGCLAEERGWFGLPEVVDGICDKLIRRHPHVFADARADDAEGARRNWEQIKVEERRGKGRTSRLDGVPATLPALLRALRLSAKAATVGFDWKEVADVVVKWKEETDELEQALASGDLGAVREELGDLLFVLANLARKCDIDPEDALRGTNRKFEDRFHHIEGRLAETGRTPEASTLEEMDGLWDEAKAGERS